jgi:uncharacterized protein YjbI with pentapeptide repeats
VKTVWHNLQKAILLLIRMFCCNREGNSAYDASQYLTFENKNLKNINFSNKKILEIFSVNSHFENCKFENMRIGCLSTGEGLTRSKFINCSFDGSRFKNFEPGHARFINCTFRNTVIHQMFSFETDFINCVFSGKIKEIIINGSAHKEIRPRLGKAKNEIYVMIF